MGPDAPLAPDDFPDFPLASPDPPRASPMPMAASPGGTPHSPPPPPPPIASSIGAGAPMQASHTAAASAPLPVATTSSSLDPDPLAQTVHLAGGSLAASGLGASRAYRLRDVHGEETTLERRDVVRMIRDGTLGPEDNLAEAGSEFKLAREFEDLRRYFQLRQAPVAAPSLRSGAPLLACGKHPALPAAWCCGMCGAYWCEACAPRRAMGNTWVTPCPHCSEPCMAVVAPAEVVPFWREIGAVFAYPVKGWGALMWIMYAAMSWISGFMWLAGLLVYFLLVVYCMLIVKDSAEGGRKVPDWPDFSMWWEIVARGFRGVACTFIALLPLGAFGIFMFMTFGASLKTPQGLIAAGFLLVIGGLPLILFTCVYYPMVFLIASVFDTIVPALNPVLIFKAIARIPFDYTIALIFIYPLMLAGFLLSLPFYKIPIIGGFPAAIVNTYFTFVWLHVLGRMAHQCEARLNWTT